MRILPYRTQNGVISGTVLTFVDISAIKETHHRLESNERRLYLALEAGAICTWEWEIQHGLVPRRSAIPLLLRHRRSHVRRHPGGLPRPGRRERPGRASRGVPGHRGDESRIETEFRVAAGSGTSRFVVLRADVDRDRTGRAVRLVGVCIDVTERKRVDMALLESQQLLKAILENSQSTIFAKDLQGRYLFINRPFPTHEHTPREKLLGKTDAELFAPDVAVTHAAEDLRSSRRASPCRPRRPSSATTARTRSSRPSSLSSTAAGRSAAWAASRPTSARSSAPRPRPARPWLRRDMFLAMLSHELRNPLGAILNASYLLLDGAAPAQAGARPRRSSAGRAN